MTTASAGDRPERPPRAWLMWIAHHTVTMVALWMTALTTCRVAAPYLPLLGYLAASAVAAGLLVAQVLARRAHWRVVLCEWCHTRNPINPAAEVVEHARPLSMWHRAQGRWWRWLSTLCIVGFLLAPDGLVGGLLGAAPLAAYSVWEAWVDKWHHRLGPWCPECGHGGRGPRSHPAPDPVPDTDPDVEHRPDPVRVTLS